METRMPVLTIDDPETYALARELSARTGQSIAEVVRETLRERLVRQGEPRVDESTFVAEVTAIAQRIASRPVLDARSADKILGYDCFGVPQ